MGKIVAIIQARMNSTRLPRKVLLDLCGKPMLSRIVERAQAIPQLDQWIVATTTQPEDDAIESLCIEQHWDCFRGSNDDVLDRFYQAAQWVKADHIVRMTADDPLVSIGETNRLIAHHLRLQADYTHNITLFGSGMPLGTSSEVFTFGALERSWREGQQPHHREHVDEYIFEHPELFHIEMVDAPPELNVPELRLTVDTAEDLTLVRNIYDHFHAQTRLIDVPEVVALLRSNNDLRILNSHVAQKRY